MEKIIDPTTTSSLERIVIPSLHDKIACMVLSDLYEKDSLYNHFAYDRLVTRQGYIEKISLIYRIVWNADNAFLRKRKFF